MKIFTKVQVFNIMPSRESGSRGHKYGFAADVRLRHYKKEMQEIKRDMKTSNFKGWLASYKRLAKKAWEFTTVIRGRAYLITTTYGEGGFIICQDDITHEVVCCMMKKTEAHITNKYWAKALAANK